MTNHPNIPATSRRAFGAVTAAFQCSCNTPRSVWSYTLEPFPRIMFSMEILSPWTPVKGSIIPASQTNDSVPSSRLAANHWQWRWSAAQLANSQLSWRISSAVGNHRYTGVACQNLMEEESNSTLLLWGFSLFLLLCNWVSLCLIACMLKCPTLIRLRSWALALPWIFGKPGNPTLPARPWQRFSSLTMDGPASNHPVVIKWIIYWYSYFQGDSQGDFGTPKAMKMLIAVQAASRVLQRARGIYATALCSKNQHENMWDFVENAAPFGHLVLALDTD